MNNSITRSAVSAQLGKSNVVPPGLARRQLELPPGIAKRDASGTLPPGIAKRFPSATLPAPSIPGTQSETVDEAQNSTPAPTDSSALNSSSSVDLLV
jgi:hypothetical protein